ncbi:MAG: carboxypeptidase regulatory-like domain-containing protein, partial [Planctomycetota bacterium]
RPLVEAGFGNGNRNRGRGGPQMMFPGQTRDDGTTVKTDAEGKYKLQRLQHLPLDVEVTHGDYLTEEKGGIDPAKQRQVDFLLDPRLGLGGTVVDSVSGLGVEQFGIAARRINARDLPDNLRQSLGLAQDNNNGPGGFGAFGQRGNRGRDQGNRGARNPSMQGNGGQGRGQGRGPGGQDGQDGQGRTPDQGRQLTPEQQQRLDERRAQMDAERQQRELEQSRRQAERTAERQQRDTQRQSLFGPSGVPFRGNPEVTAHPGGGFSLDKLEPGLYVLDIQAPGYRKIAAGPFQLEKGVAPPAVRVSLDRGRFIEGVVSRKDSSPLANVRVELMAPPPPGNQTAGSNDFLQQLFRGPDNGTRLDQATTDGDGRFRFEGVASGRYRLVASADGYATLTDDTIEVTQVADVKDLRYKLSPGARVYGKVTNREEGETYRVIIAGDSGDRRFARIDEKEGTFDEKGLDPGRYRISLVKGNNWMSSVMSAASQGGIQPNLILGEGDERQWNFNAADEELGGIEGTIYLNGQATQGIQVTLSPVEGASTLDPDALQGMGRMRRMMNRTLQGRTDAEGHYSVTNVPPGQYELEVQRRSDRQRSRTIHREVVQIGTGGARHLDLQLVLGRLELEAYDQDQKKVDQARMFLVLASEGQGRDPQEWRGLNSFQRADLRGGRLVLDDVATGEWMYTFSARGFETKQGTLFVAAPPAPSQLRIEVQRRQPQAPQQGEQGK